MGMTRWQRIRQSWQEGWHGERWLIAAFAAIALVVAASDALR